MAFTYPWFLAGLLLILVPVAIHLFELRQPKRIRFTNVKFIREVKLVTARQRKLKHLLVLLTRVSFLVFLVLVFAQPYIKAPSGNENKHAIVNVLVDNTASMQAAGKDDASLFEQAVEQAKDIPRAYPTTASFVALNESRRPLSSGAYQASIDKLRVSGQQSGLNDIAYRASSVNSVTKELFMFSDFQKSGFSANSLAQFDSTTQVFLVPIATKNVANVSVDSVWLDDAFVRSNMDMVLHIRLQNGGEASVDNCQVKLFIGERQAAVLRMAVPSGKQATTSVRLRLPDSRLAECRVELEDYPITFDNTFYFTLQPSPKIKVLDIGQQQAVATQRVYANEPLFSYASVRGQALNYQVLEAANLVLVQAQPQIGPSLRESLRQVVQRGGSVVVVPSEAATGRTSYDELFTALGIGPVQWEAAGAAPILRDVAAPTSQNPFFKDVFGAKTRQAAMPKVSPVLRWSRSDANILRMRDGDGFLAGFSSGKGTVYLFSSPLSTSYSDFTQHALFVPVMYRLAMQSYQRQQQPAYRLNQGNIVLNLPDETSAKSGEAIFRLTKDSAVFIPEQQVRAGMLRFSVPAEMRAPGFYDLTRNGKAVATMAFNFDKRESKLAAYSAEELRQLIGPNRPNVHVYDGSAKESAVARYRAERVGTPLWQYCLWAALACLLAEVLLLRFMRTSKPAASVPVAA